MGDERAWAWRESLLMFHCTDHVLATQPARSRNTQNSNSSFLPVFSPRYLSHATEVSPRPQKLPAV